MVSAQQETSESVPRWVRGLIVLALLYLFLTGVALLEAGINAMGSNVQESLFQGITNPIAGLCVGVLATILVQSSSVSTSTIVSLVAGGVISVNEAVPMVMGANIGTTVTTTLVSLGHIRRPQEFRRAFEAATVHDFFNLAAVIVLLPLQVAFGVISKSATWFSDLVFGTGGVEVKSPLKQAVKAPAGWIQDLFGGMGLAGTALGVLLVIVGLAFIFLSLAFITRNMKALLAERVEASMNRMLGSGGGIVAMAFGLVFTISVQSSSITTSILVPLAAAGIVTLENVYPVTLGANVGTTVTALLASLATGSIAALTVALAHTIFNVYGIVLFYPLSLLRRIPVRLARGLGGIAANNRLLAVGYVVALFIVLPLLGLAILR